jgi:eukaryotic-like serine/threonine-protein kinase
MRVGGKYRLGKRLAVGGMGEVWVARNQATGADIALKLCGGDAANEEAALRFRQEARLGAMLSHRSIVRIFDLVEETDGTLLLVMELLRGQTLDRHLRTRGPLPSKEAIAIMLPVLSALAHAHDRGIVHRDVSPANIFLTVDPDGQVIPKLVDFGIAKLPASGVKTIEGSVLGTPRYMAPERIRAQSDVDGRSDLFSIGVILYEMHTGSSPFDATSPSASLAAVLEVVVDPDPRIDPPVWIELQRALAKRPYERHAGARQMADALRTASGETEASLAHWLQRSPPPRDDVTPDVSPPPGTRSVGGHSVGSTGAFPARRGTLAAWLVVGALVGCLALAATAAVRYTRKAPAAPTATSLETVSPRPPMGTTNPPPPAAEPRLSTSTSPANSTMPTPAPATTNPGWPSHTRRPKPVAITPGF